MDDEEAIWYALLKDEAAPGKSIQGDVAWVAADDVEASGDCDAVPIITGEGDCGTCAATRIHRIRRYGI